MNLSDKLADSAVTRQIRLQRYSAGLRNRVISLLEDAATDIIAKLSGAKELTTFSRDRLTKQLSDIRQLIDKYYQDITGLTAVELQDLARIEGEWAAKTINTAVGAEIVSAMPSEKVLGELAKDTLIMGAPSAEWWKRQSGDFQFRFVNEMRMGLAQGETNAQLVKRVRSVEQISKRNAEALVRTSAQTVASEARRATYKANDDVIKGIQQVSTLDGRTTDICIAYSGASWDLEGSPINGTTLPYNGGTPRHWSCFPGDTPVLARSNVTAASRRLFDGKVIVLKTASGLNLTCTPNHPILTLNGWVPAHALDVGGHVIRDLGSEWTGFVNGDNNDVVSSIHDVTESFFRSRGVVPVPMPLAAKDFHGDGAGSKVAVVWSDRFLRNGVDSSFLEHFKEHGFVSRHFAGSFGLVSYRHLFKGILTRLPAFAGLMGAFSKAQALLWSKVSHAGSLLLGAVSRLNPMLEHKPCYDVGSASKSLADASRSDPLLMKRDNLRDINIVPTQDGPVKWYSGFLESAPEDGCSYAKVRRDFLGGYTGLIEADEIVSIDVASFHGDVYNLETEDGWYVANGIVTHNCRSTEIPITKTFRELGLDIDEFPKGTRSSMDGQVAKDLSFDDFLKGKPKSFADDLLGPGRAELWRDGKITLQQLVGGDGNPLTLEQLRKL